MGKKITDRQARAIKLTDKPLAAGVTGLTLQPTTVQGRGKWNLRFVSPVTGKRRDMGLGVFPDVAVAGALEEAERARKLIAAGRDPIDARQVLQTVPTFEQAARQRWEQVAPSFRNAKHRTQWLTSLEQHIFPSVGALKVDALTPKHFADVLAPIWLEIPETAKRTKMRCADVMSACWARGFTQSNPLDVVEHLLPSNAAVFRQHHQPAMAWKDVPAFIKQHLSEKPIVGARAALLFLILTAARSGEVRGATWQEIDFDAALWIVPAARMKAGKDHRVPLSGAALGLLRHQLWGEHKPRPDTLIFPALRGGQLSDMALTSFLRRVKPASDVAGRVATAHGFRSSFRNWAADNGYESDLAERALAHVIANKVQAAYERTDRLEARQKMMNQWAGFVITSGVGCE